MSAQSQTLNRLEDNISDTRKNTGQTVIELSTAVKSEAPTLAERVTAPIGADLSTTCVAMWFVFAFAMFMVDF